jgi:hypothetical protein
MTDKHWPPDWKTAKYWQDNALFYHKVDNPTDNPKDGSPLPQWVLKRRNPTLTDKDFSDRETPPPYNSNNYYFNSGASQELGTKRANGGLTSRQKWGFYAEKFDEVMCENSSRQDKRVVAETIGLKATSDTFRKLLARRIEERKVRPYRGSHYLIE